jgi:hypothetical protein
MCLYVRAYEPMEAEVWWYVGLKVYCTVYWLIAVAHNSQPSLKNPKYKVVFRIRIHTFLGLLDPDP